MFIGALQVHHQSVLSQTEKGNQRNMVSLVCLISFFHLGINVSFITRLFDKTKLSLPRRAIFPYEKQQPRKYLSGQIQRLSAFKSYLLTSLTFTRITLFYVIFPLKRCLVDASAKRSQTKPGFPSVSQCLARFLRQGEWQILRIRSAFNRVPKRCQPSSVDTPSGTLFQSVGRCFPD